MVWTTKATSKEILDALRSALEGRQTDLMSLASKASRSVAELLLQVRSPHLNPVLETYINLLDKISRIASRVLFNQLNVTKSIVEYVRRLLSGSALLSRTGCVFVEVKRETGLRLKHSSKFLVVDKGVIACLPLEYAIGLASIGDVTLLTHSPRRHEYRRSSEGG